MSFEPGWYPDPMQRYEHRYYDGSAWTEHVASGGTQAVDHLEGTSPGSAATLPDTGDATRTSTSDAAAPSGGTASSEAPATATSVDPEIPTDAPLTTTTAISAAQAAAELAELKASTPPDTGPTDTVSSAPTTTEPIESTPEVAQTEALRASAPAQAQPMAEAAPAPDPVPDPVAAAVAPATPTAPASAGGGLVLPDDPDGAPKRRLWGIVMLGAAGAVVLSLALPWVSGTPEAATGDGPHTVAGFQWMYAWFAAAIAVGMGFYGLQGVKRPRVRFHVLALIGIIFLVSAAFGGTLDPDESAREQLGVEQRQTSVGVNLGTGTTTVTTSDASPVETEPGLWLALVAGLVMIAPLVVLWRDDRRRRAALLLAGAAAAGPAPGHVPQPQSGAQGPATIQPPAPDPATLLAPAAASTPSTSDAVADREPATTTPVPDPATPVAEPDLPVAEPVPAVAAVAADWYPDPSGRFELRYHDGSAWTEHVAQSGAQIVDPNGGVDAAAPASN